MIFFLATGFESHNVVFPAKSVSVIEPRKYCLSSSQSVITSLRSGKFNENLMMMEEKTFEFYLIKNISTLSTQKNYFNSSLKTMKPVDCVSKKDPFFTISRRSFIVSAPCFTLTNSVIFITFLIVRCRFVIL